MNRRQPPGLGGQRAPADGVAPYAGSRVPGSNPIPIAPRTPRSIAAPGRTDVIDALIGVPFEVGMHRYLLRRIDAKWRCGGNEDLVDPKEALGILGQAIAQHRNHARLTGLLETAATQLARLHEGGVFVLLWLRPESRVEPVAGPAPASTPSPSPAPVAAAPKVEESPMPPLQALVLKAAARNGVPFCEECARAAAAEAASPLPFKPPPSARS